MAVQVKTWADVKDHLEENHLVITGEAVTPAGGFAWVSDANDNFAVQVAPAEGALRNAKTRPPEEAPAPDVLEERE